MDLALTVFDFGAAGFWELVHNVRLSVLTAAAALGAPLVVMTCCYADPGDRAAFQPFLAIVNDASGDILPVFLHCSKDELVRRVAMLIGPIRARLPLSGASTSSLHNTTSRLYRSPTASCWDSEITSADATASRESLRRFDLELLK